VLASAPSSGWHCHPPGQPQPPSPSPSPSSRSRPACAPPGTWNGSPTTACGPSGTALPARPHPTQPPPLHVPWSSSFKNSPPAWSTPPSSCSSPVASNRSPSPSTAPVAGGNSWNWNAPLTSPLTSHPTAWSWQHHPKQMASARVYPTISQHIQTRCPLGDSRLATPEPRPRPRVVRQPGHRPRIGT